MVVVAVVVVLVVTVVAVVTAVQVSGRGGRLCVCLCVYNTGIEDQSIAADRVKIKIVSGSNLSEVAGFLQPYYQPIKEDQNKKTSVQPQSMLPEAGPEQVFKC